MTTGPNGTQAISDDEASRAGLSSGEFDRDWIRDHVAEERRAAAVLGDIREAIFGAQDGLVSTLGVVSVVAGASADRFQILVVGIATGLAGVFSMAAG
ncbi:MAG: VIT1/CCC1 transporter family protein, partial [Candidatus Limnocylindria bacterium]